MDITALKKYYNSVLINYGDPTTGWCGNHKLVVNLLVSDISSGDDTNNYRFVSPYGISTQNSGISLIDTINLKDNSTSLDDTSRTTKCSTSNIYQVPCFGGLSTKGNWNIDAGCDKTNPSYTYPTKARLPGATKTTLPKIVNYKTGESIVLGTWQKDTGFGPQKQRNHIVTDNKWVSKLNYNTHILSSSKVSLGIMGPSPSIARIYVNIVSSSLKNTELLSDEGSTKLLCNYVANTIPTNNKPYGFIASITNTIVTDALAVMEVYKTVKEMREQIEKLEKILEVAKASVVSVPGEAIEMEVAGPIFFETWIAYAIGLVTTFASNVATYIAQVDMLQTLYYQIFPDIIKDICKFYRYNYITLVCKSKGGFLEIPKLFCHLTGYKKYLEKIKELGDAWAFNNYDVFREAINDIYDICLDNNIQLFDIDSLLYKPVSVAYVMENSSSIIGNSRKSGDGAFPFAKVGGICAMDGCDEGQNNKYCSCNEDTPYTCPFESYSNNLTSCQASLIKLPNSLSARGNSNPNKVTPIDEMRKNMLYWFNTMVGTNGCFQRSLAMKYGKSIKLDEESLNISTWDTHRNKFVINNKVDENLFK